MCQFAHCQSKNRRRPKKKRSLNRKVGEFKNRIGKCGIDTNYHFGHENVRKHI